MDRKHAVVVLEIFSGRPDPSWKLDEPKVTELERRLRELRPAPDAVLPPDPGLGYRGLHVTIAGGAQREVVSVREGRIVYDGRVLLDPGRDLERWLLDTAPPEIDQNVVRSVKQLF